ncbi:MAG: PHP domain-containing protein [Eubacteriales bacterium]|jgi:predicted metal-dependent phosphoesterase TrpH|nr:PHP domain-containing protein [Eubacteriales bacterium]
MKFDMHCHTKAGSIDSKVSIENYINILKEKGFDGLLVTDHDSYKGYKYWKNNKEAMKHQDFVVLQGVEYDTRDAGHFLVIMPDDVHLRVLQIRGMSVDMLTKIVHHFGGILGPAHPFGVRSSSAMFFNKMKKNPHIINDFDFLEGFNTCESPESNRVAQLLAKRYDKPCTGGSDSHEEKYVGMAYTEFDADIRCNDDLIAAIKNGDILGFGGTEREYTKKAKHKNAFYGVWGFKAYNWSLGLLYTPYRQHKIKKLALHHN